MTQASPADFKRVKYTGSIQRSKTTPPPRLLSWTKTQRAPPGWRGCTPDVSVAPPIRNDLVTACGMIVPPQTTLPRRVEAIPTPTHQFRRWRWGPIGFNPNRLAFFGAAWTKRIAASRGKNTAGAIASLNLSTADQVAQYVGAQRGTVVNFRVKSAAGKGKVSGNTVVAFYAEDGAGPEDPSHTKRFWSPCGDGTQYRVYVRVPELAIVERYVQLVVTSNRTQEIHHQLRSYGVRAITDNDIDAGALRPSLRSSGCATEGTIPSPPASARDRCRGLHPPHAPIVWPCRQRLIDAALSLFVVRVYSRTAGLLIDLNDTRKEAAKSATELLRDVAAGRFAVELPAEGTTSEEDNNASAVQLVTHSARPLRRDDLAGL